MKKMQRRFKEISRHRHFKISTINVINTLCIVHKRIPF